MGTAAPCLNLRNRLTSAAESELSPLLTFLSPLHLHPSSIDTRYIRGATSVQFSTALSYSHAFSHLPNDAFVDSICHNLAPSRCRSFLWLVHHSKINTHVRLRSRRANNTGLCNFCGAEEDVPHLFLHCPGHKISCSCLASILTTSLPLNFFIPLTTLGLLFPTRLCAQPLSPSSCGLFGSAGTPRFSA